MDALRLVVLHHTGIDEPHFDFMFEASPGAPLKTWRIAAWPMPGDAEQPAVELADHRPNYLEYEGPVSGNRGEVRRVAAGTARLLEDHADAKHLDVHFDDSELQRCEFLLSRHNEARWLIRRVR